MTRWAAVLLCCCLALPARCHDDTPETTLRMTATERSFFQLGAALGRASFAYAGLAQQSGQLLRAGATDKVSRLAALAGAAGRSRAQARREFTRALALMHQLGAPPAALQPVAHATNRLGRPLAITGDARAVALFSTKAAQTLASLDEYSVLSPVPEDLALQHWLTSAAAGPAAHVWYAEGVISALGQIAARLDQPDLLPPVKEIATDLRGLRDWLTLRVPDPPTSDQASLEAEIDGFLDDASQKGVPQTGHLDMAQMNTLADIAQRLQAQIGGKTVAAAPS